MKVQRRITKECGFYYVEESKNNFETCKAIAFGTTREEAEKKMRETK